MDATRRSRVHATDSKQAPCAIERLSRPSRKWLGSAIAAVMVLLIVALAGTASASREELAGTASASREETAARRAPKPMPAGQWRKLVAQAKSEGSVTLYFTGPATGAKAVADGFKAKFGITVNVNRNVDNPLLAQINAEHGTGNAIADIWATSTVRYVYGAVENGWVVDPRGPNFFKKRFDRSKYTFSRSFLMGFGVLGYAWNTKAYSDSVTGPNSFADASFGDGRIGVPDPRVSQGFMDWYLWLQEKYGPNILTQLAARNPKIYTSTLPMTQAVASGEIVGTPCAVGSSISDLKDAGAPIQYKTDDFNVGFYAMLLKQAPHPAAAQLFSNFLVSPEGQRLLNQGNGAIYPKLSGTYYVSKPRVPKLRNFTPAKVKAFTDRWTSLFLS